MQYGLLISSPEPIPEIEKVALYLKAYQLHGVHPGDCVKLELQPEPDALDPRHRVGYFAIKWRA